MRSFLNEENKVEDSASDKKQFNQGFYHFVAKLILLHDARAIFSQVYFTAYFFASHAFFVPKAL